MIEHELFHWSSSIHSACVLHSAAYHHLHDWDALQKTIKKEKKQKSNSLHPDCYDTLEGHIVLTGGGDKDPRVHLVNPRPGSVSIIGERQTHS